MAPKNPVTDGHSAAPRVDHVGAAGTTGLGNATHVDVQPSTQGENNNQDRDDEPGPLPSIVTTSPRKRTGTSMSSQGGTGVPGRKVAAWIRDDIKVSNRTRVHIVDFLKVMVMQCAVDAAADPTETLQKVVEVTTRVYNSNQYEKGREWLDKYCDITTEAAGYEPLTECFNEAFRLLEDEDIPELKDKNLNDLIFRNNAEKSMEHHYRLVKKGSSLKPDLCIVTNRLSGSLDEKDKEKLQWPHVPGTAEVKIQGLNGFTKQEKGKRSVVPPKDVKEYMVLPDQEIERQDKCASVTFAVDPEHPDKALIHPKDRFDHEWLSHSSHSTVYTKTASRASHSVTRMTPSAPDNEVIAKLRQKRKRGPESPPETNDSRHGKRRYVEPKDLLPTEQVSVYGLEMLCRGIYSMHAINLIIVDDLVWVWWYDRQNVIQTTGLNFVQDMPYFMVLLALFQRFTLRQWGIEETLVSADTKFILPDDPLEFVSFKLDAEDGEIVASVQHPAPNDLHCRGPVLIGRATCILNANSDTQAGKSLALKASWPEEKRASEVLLIKQAHEAVKDSKFAKNLPKLLGWKDVHNSSTGEIIAAIKKIGRGIFAEKNPRILRLLLFRRLKPLNKLEKPENFMKAWVDCLKCHYALWNKGIQHCDISVWNLMWDAEDRCGILNDFDLAVVKGSNQFRGGERTGTLPFMSRRMLGSPFSTGQGVRSYEDELESFVWVFAWLCMREFVVDPEKDENWDWRFISDIGKMTGHKTFFLNEYETISLPQGYPYPRAWKRCKCLLALLKQIDMFCENKKTFGFAGDLPFKDLFQEAVKMMGKTYLSQDLGVFQMKMRKIVDDEIAKLGGNVVNSEDEDNEDEDGEDGDGEDEEGEDDIY